VRCGSHRPGGTMEPYRLAYRIEDAWGSGPWTAYGPRGRSVLGSYTKKPGWRNSPGEMPLTREDTLKRRFYSDTVKNGRYAFPNVERLRYWFCPGALAFLHECGLACSVYAVAWRHHNLYENQIVFNVQFARLIRRVPLTRLIGVPVVRALPLAA
jgi:hypothetical protein